MKKVIICLSIVVALILAIAFLIYSVAPYNYGRAKKDCMKFLDNNRKDMEEIAISSLNGDQDNNGYYKEKFYSYDASCGTISFDIDSQGMLGGQYWSLIYTENGIYNGESEEYLYKENGGNNVIRAEKLDEHWWFCWIDYDGTDRSYK